MSGRRSALAFAAAVLALALIGVNWAGLGPALAQGRTWTTQLTLSDLRGITCAGTCDCWAAGTSSIVAAG
jgi:hypothetical protein